MTTTDKIEQLIEILETMIKTRIRIHEERSYSNHREVWKILDEVYDPARAQLKQALVEYIDEAVERKFKVMKDH